MGPRQRQRLELTHNLLQDVRSKEFREATAETTRSGEHVVVPALPDDRMSGLFEKLRAVDGPLHVALREDDGYALFVMEPHKRPRHACTKPSTQDCAVSPDTEVGLVLAYLRACGRPIFCYEASPCVALKLVDEEFAGFHG